MDERVEVLIPGEQSQDQAAMVDLGERRKRSAETTFDPSNGEYSVYLSDNPSQADLTYNKLEQLSVSPQSSLTKTQQIIDICRQYTNKNDVIGMTAESIENNINTEIRLSYREPKRNVASKAAIESAKVLVKEFNDRIDINRLISQAVLTTFVDGTYVAYRRKVEREGFTDYQVDMYPLGVAIISDYEMGGIPYVLIDMNALKSALSKNYPKNKKRKGIFFDNVEEEIKATYPPEVYKAYVDKEQYAKLDIESTCVLRIGNQNKKYGLSCIFRALYPAMMLEAFEKADRSNAQARAKKIIVQLMNKEFAGPEFERNTFADQSYAHKNFLDAWKQKTVVTTAPPSVKDMKYVEPTVEMTNIETVNYYRTRIMSTLGISFLMDGGSASLSMANISLAQLMRKINRISAQLEDVLHRWYKALLRDNGLDPELAPTIDIIDAEMLAASMKMEMAKVLFNSLNCSYETAYETLGLSIEDEKIKRQRENEAKLEEIFMPRATSYTMPGSGSSSTGKSTEGRGQGNKTGGDNGNEDDGNDNDEEPVDDVKKQEKKEYDANRYKTNKEFR